MNDWAGLFLGVIALATLLTAVVQIAVVVVVARLARRMERLADRVEHELKPMFSQLNAVGRDASKMSALATAQAERLDHALAGVAGRPDQALADVAGRLEDTLVSVQASAAGTAREGVAVLAGVKAALAALKEGRAGRARSRVEEEDALFI